MAVQWLRLQTSSAGDTGSVSGQGTRMTPAAQTKKKFVEVSLYKKLMKAQYVVHCKVVKSISFIKKPIFVEKSPALGNGAVN